MATARLGGAGHRLDRSYPPGVGEAEGRWFWLVLYPALIEMIFGGTPPLW